jgi:hypothetical protein
MSAADVMKKIKEGIDATGSVGVNDEELEELSLEELRSLADGQVRPKPKVEDKTTVRKPEETEEEEVDEDDEEEDEEAFRREIDLGDGSGVQVFKAATLEKLLDKLAEAQKNATKKIREQAQQLKKYSAQAEAEAADNEYVVGQELMSKPTAAFKRLFKETTGVDIDSFKNSWERLQAWEQSQAVQSIENKKNEAATQFLAAHPEFITNSKNGARLEKAINLLVADAERNGQEIDFGKFIEEAYADLKESGLLEIKDTEAEPAKKEAPVEKPVVLVATNTRKASGLSSRARTVTQPRNTEPTEEDLYNMPLDKLRELGMKQSR